MEIIKIDGVTKCDMPTCRNNANYAIGGEGVMPRRRLNICLACAVELYGLLGAMITPKSPKNHIQAAYENQMKNKMNLSNAIGEYKERDLTLNEKINPYKSDEINGGDLVQVERQEVKKVVNVEGIVLARQHSVKATKSYKKSEGVNCKRDNGSRHDNRNSAISAKTNERSTRVLIGVKC